MTAATLKPTEFADRNGRAWSLQLSVPVIRRIKKDLGVDLNDQSSGNSLAKIESDPVLFADTLWAIVREQAGDVTDEQFGAAIASREVVDAATLALRESIVNLYPSSRRELMKSVLEKNSEVSIRSGALALAKISDGRQEALIEQIAERAANEAIDSVTSEVAAK